MPHCWKTHVAAHVYVHVISARDCKMSEWAEWGSCSATCGPEAVKERRRDILVKPKFGGMDCPSRREKQSCHLAECTNEKVSFHVF